MRVRLARQLHGMFGTLPTERHPVAPSIVTSPVTAVKLFRTAEVAPFRESISRSPPAVNRLVPNVGRTEHADRHARGGAQDAGRDGGRSLPATKTPPVVDSSWLLAILAVPAAVPTVTASPVAVRTLLATVTDPWVMTKTTTCPLLARSWLLVTAIGPLDEPTLTRVAEVSVLPLTVAALNASTITRSANPSS